MSSFQFTALGTAWSITIDQADSVQEVPQSLWKSVVDRTAEFERRFSRFKDGSETRAFLKKAAGTHSISTEMCDLLSIADRLRTLTDGAYDPAVGGLLEAAGYNKDYRLKPDEQQLHDWHIPTWSLDQKKKQVTIDGPLLFDFGGMGKGYWIDQLSNFLLVSGYPYHLVEGGGDMFATTKASGQSWKIAIEYPGQQDQALGTYQLSNQGFAASDVFRRKWGKWHHFVDVSQNQPTQHLVGCVAVATTAWKADQITSVLALCQPAKFAQIVGQIGGEYVVLLANGEARVSSNWKGQLF